MISNPHVFYLIDLKLYRYTSSGIMRFLRFMTAFLFGYFYRIMFIMFSGLDFHEEKRPYQINQILCLLTLVLRFLSDECEYSQIFLCDVMMLWYTSDFQISIRLFMINVNVCSFWQIINPQSLHWRYLIHLTNNFTFIYDICIFFYKFSDLIGKVRLHSNENMFMSCTAFHQGNHFSELLENLSNTCTKEANVVRTIFSVYWPWPTVR